MSPKSVYRILKTVDRLAHSTRTPPKKGTSIAQPMQAHWYIDFTYVNIAGTLYYILHDSRWLVALSRPLGDAGIHDDVRRHDHTVTGQRMRSGRPSAHDFG